MNVLTGFSLYLFGAFLLIVLRLTSVLPTNFLGGFVIAGFVGGLVFPFVNAVRQGEKMIASEKVAAIAEVAKREEEPITVTA